MSTEPENPSRRKRGRPPAAPQTMPAALSAPLARTRVTFEIPSCTVVELREYVAWLVTCWGVPEREAQAAALDTALRRFLRADRLWQEHRRSWRQAVAPVEVSPEQTPGAESDLFDEPTIIGEP